MRKYFVLALNIFLLMTAAQSQQLYPDSAVIEKDQLSMVLPKDSVVTPAIAVVDSIFFPWIGWECGGNVDYIGLTTTYTVTVTEPNPCVDTSLRAIFIDVPTICFTYPWILSSWQSECRHGCGRPCDLWMLAPDPFTGWHQIDLLGADTAEHSSPSSFSATNSRQISSSPPDETPEPPKSVPIPEQPWYQAILPTPLRPRKNG